MQCTGGAVEVQRRRFRGGAGAEQQRSAERCRCEEVMRCTGAQVHRCTGSDVQRYRGTEVQRYRRGSEVQRCRDAAEVQGCRVEEMQSCRGAGL